MYKSFIALMVFLAIVVARIILLPTTWYMKVVILIATYLFLMFFLSRLIIPRLGFKKARLPGKLPKVLQEEVNKLKGSKEAILKKSYELVTKRFYGGEGRTILEFSKLFWKDPEKEWERGGFAQCNTQNYFLRMFLIKSGKFKESDIKIIHSMFRLSIHQILAIKLNKGWVYADPWGNYKGIPLGRKVDSWLFTRYKEDRYSGLYVKPEFAPA